MRSTFPGMDPYLEDPAFWEDFHRRFITGIADYLLERLPADYDARIDQRVRLMDMTGVSIGSRLPDVSVSKGGEAKVVEERAATATMEPATVPMPEVEERRDVWVEILHLPERALVTSIEVLSPTNKSGDGLMDYMSKRLELYGRGVNLVELDLLLGGERLHFGKPLPPADYYAAVAAVSKRPMADDYGWNLREPLPAIPVPLRPADGTVTLNIGEVFAAVFERGRYRGRLRYSDVPSAPLPLATAAWVRELAQKAAN